ncbi:hypothetical protein SAMN05444521_2109 [Streptomyces sp. 3214.6]|nr:hypothetical protein SAMN05444521_2109 [Streptomyces sp. 3214.6]
MGRAYGAAPPAWTGGNDTALHQGMVELLDERDRIATRSLPDFLAQRTGIGQVVRGTR